MHVIYRKNQFVYNLCSCQFSMVLTGHQILQVPHKTRWSLMSELEFSYKLYTFSGICGESSTIFGTLMCQLKTHHIMLKYFLFFQWLKVQYLLDKEKKKQFLMILEIYILKFLEVCFKFIRLTFQKREELTFCSKCIDKKQRGIRQLKYLGRYPCTLTKQYFN